MIITNKLTLDLQTPGTVPTIHAVQNDSYSRNLEITLYANRLPFIFPETGRVVIRYKKSDGKGGEYDTLPDGRRAWQSDRNILTIALAPQVLTTPGSVSVTVTLIDEETQLSVFPIRLAVEPIAAAKLAASEDYFYITGLLPAPVSGTVGQSLRISAINSEGRITAVEAADKVAPQKGIDYWTDEDKESIVQDVLKKTDMSTLDPTVYGLPVLYLTGDTTGMSKENAISLDYTYGERSGECTLKWQGGSSLSYPKKNYTIKFDHAFEAAEGWGEQKKYCLKANYIDFSHARNIVSAKLWGEIVKSRQDEGGVAGMIGTNNSDKSQYLNIENGVINVRTTVYKSGFILFTGNTYPAGEHTITFELYNPYTAETDTTFAVFVYGVPGAEDTDYDTVNVNSREKYGQWLSRSVTVDFPVDGSMIGIIAYSPDGDPTGENGGYSFRNIKIDGETYPIEPKINVLKSFVNGGAIDGFPVCVYINGQYTGLYTFNIPKDKWMFGIGSGESECILCANNHTEATKFKAAALCDGSDFEIEYIPDEANTAWAVESVNTLISSVMNSDGTDIDSTISKYLDIQSAIDFYIFISLLSGGDNVDKNYLLVTYDGVKWFFSTYDMDSTFGNTWTGKGYKSIKSSPTLLDFSNKAMQLVRDHKTGDVKARYRQLRSTVMSEDNVLLQFENFMAGIPSALYEQDTKLWPSIPGTKTNNIAQIANNYRLRVQLLDSQIEEI